MLGTHLNLLLPIPFLKNLGGLLQLLISLSRQLNLLCREYLIFDLQGGLLVLPIGLNHRLEGLRLFWIKERRR